MMVRDLNNKVGQEKCQYLPKLKDVWKWVKYLTESYLQKKGRQEKLEFELTETQLQAQTLASANHFLETKVRELVQLVNKQVNGTFEQIDDKLLNCIEQVFEGYNSIGTVSINMGNASLN
jgi:hypothetical protein